MSIVPSNNIGSVGESPNDNTKDKNTPKTAFDRLIESPNVYKKDTPKQELSKPTFQTKEEFRADKLRYIKNKLLTGRIIHYISFYYHFLR